MGLPKGVAITAPTKPEFEAILSPEALHFLAKLAREFGARRESLLARRRKVQARLAQGEQPRFLPETEKVRQGSWKIAPVPVALLDRRVEITGPVDRKMVINALNCGARVYMADFEDSHSPTWFATLQGQINLRDAINRSVDFESPEGKTYRLNEKVATLFVRPRGWHLVEKHILIDGAPLSASLFDFGLFFFHNAKKQIARAGGPFFYLPKLENHLEARLWNEVFIFAQDELGIPYGTIKATVLIETILAAFEMDEILYELRAHSAGLNCGRWDYIFSFIKKFNSRSDAVLPDRGAVTMEQPFLKAYSELLIQTCHRRGAHAMGGMAAQIPIKDNVDANRAAIEKVRADKEREAKAGHDGTWVAHPGLVGVAMEVFDRYMPGPNQLSIVREDVKVTAPDLLRCPQGSITEAGLRNNINVGVRYLEAWLRGNGCVPLHHLMEDAATAEIARAQVWQWIRHPSGLLADGRKVTVELFRSILEEELGALKKNLGETEFKQSKFSLSVEIFDKLICDSEFPDFLTLRAYPYL